MKKKAIFIVIFLLSLSFSVSYSQEPSQTLHVKELIMNTVNGPSEITFDIVSTSAKVWQPQRSGNPSAYLTNDKKYVDPENITLPGNYSKGDKGWDTDGYYPGQQHVLGRGYYRISVWGKSATLNVDCYGTNFLGDVIVVYDYLNDVFKVNGNTVTGIILYDDPSGLQPTPPRNFTCTNASHVGQHPYFTWSPPSDPTGVTFSYNVYRNLGAGYSKINGAPITATSYTDTEIEIVKNGANAATYYATAMGSQSPESEPSNTASIQTNIAEKSILPGGSVSEKSENNQQRHSLQLSNYPNPFNPVTRITYFLPDEGPIRLSVFNLKGQRIGELVNAWEQAGQHSFEWNGAGLPGGVYFLRLKFENRYEIKKILLLE